MPKGCYYSFKAVIRRLLWTDQDGLACCYYIIEICNPTFILATLITWSTIRKTRSPFADFAYVSFYAKLLSGKKKKLNKR